MVMRITEYDRGRVLSVKPMVLRTTVRGFLGLGPIRRRYDEQVTEITIRRSEGKIIKDYVHGDCGLQPGQEVGLELPGGIEDAVVVYPKLFEPVCI